METRSSSEAEGVGDHTEGTDAEQRGEDPAEGGAGGDPDDVRADKRVAEDALEGGAAQQGEQDAGQADVEGDALFVAGPGAVDGEELSGEETDDLVGRDDVAAQRRRGKGDQQGEDGEKRQAQAAGKAPRPPLLRSGLARG